MPPASRWHLMGLTIVLIYSIVVASACTNDPSSCGFGGVCTSNSCVCREEWTGPNCTNLNLNPAVNPFAFSSPSENVSSWGGSVVCLSSGCWMALAYMEGNCGLNSWEANSAVVLASASGPADVFRPYKTLMSPFAHNPTLHAVPGGGLLIAHIGQGKPEHPLISNCTNGTTPLPTDSEVKHPSSKPALKLGVRGASLPAPNFLYLASGDPTDGSEWEVIPSSSAWAANNPGLYIHPNGSVLLVYKVGCACEPPCTFCRQFGIATAPSWKGPYTDGGLIPVYGEDAYIWADPPTVPNPGYHMLFQGGSYAPQYPVYKGHFHTAFSPNGFDWSVNVFSEVFNTTIPLQGGDEVVLSRRERHQVLFDTTGSPIYLYNGGMGVTGGDHSFTVGQPINGNSV